MPATSPSNLLTKLFYEQLSRHPTGKPFYIEDWETIRAWYLGQSGDGTGDITCVTAAEYAQARKRPCVFNGKTMGKLLSSGANNGYCFLYYCHAPLPNERYGFETNWAWPFTFANLNTRLGNITLAGMWREFETYRVEPRLIYTRSTDTLYFHDGNATHALLTNVYGTHYYISNGYLIWQNAKLVVDMANEVGVRAYFNERSFDLSSYSLAHLASLYPYNHNCMYTGVNDVASALQFQTYYGTIFLTTEEEV